MSIKKIYFQICETSDNRHKQSDLLFKTHFITEYFSKLVARKKYVVGNANKLLIYLDAKEESTVVSEEFKSFDVFLDGYSADILKLNESDFINCVLNCLLISLDKLKDCYPDVAKDFEEMKEAFYFESCKNKWMHKKKRIKGVGIAKLCCELNKDEFLLSLIVESKDVVLYEQVVLKELPDRLCYAHEFKDLIVADSDIKITNRKGDVIFNLPLVNITK